MKSQTHIDAESYVKSSSGNRNTITRDINFCLAPCDQCTGLYIDSIRGNILQIICHHQCHFDIESKPTANPIKLTNIIPYNDLKKYGIKKRGSTFHEKKEDVSSDVSGIANVIQQLSHDMRESHHDL